MGRIVFPHHISLIRPHLFDRLSHYFFVLGSSWYAHSVMWVDALLTPSTALQVHGEHAQDILHMGDDSNSVRIEAVIFAQVTQVIDFAVCEEEEGILGLGNSLSTSHQFPSLLKSLLLSQPPVLKHNLFGMYLQSSRNDYGGDVNTGSNLSTTASSQLVLGGVDQSHYLGCLQWHSLVQSGQEEDNMTAQNWDKYWTVPLEAVKVGGTTLATVNGGKDHVAVFDSGSSYVVGPQDSVAHMVKLNGAKCFALEAMDNPQQVDCDSPNGFDGAVLNSCDDPFFNLEFIIEGITYVLEKEDLLVKIETLFGEACILRVVGAQGMEVSVFRVNVLFDSSFSSFLYELTHRVFAVAYNMGMLHDRDGFWGTPFSISTTQPLIFKTNDWDWHWRPTTHKIDATMTCTWTLHTFGTNRKQRTWIRRGEWSMEQQ